MLTFIDTHCHLDAHDEASVRDQVERARADGVAAMITVGTDLASSVVAVGTAARNADVYAAVGIHPNDAMEATEAVLERIAQLACQPRVVAIGETGLDFYRDWCEPPRQREAFRAHIGLAKRFDRTLVVHCRDAWDDVLAILDDEGAPSRVVLHCFSGDADLAVKCAERGYYLSFAGNVTFRNAGTLREAAAAAPLDRLLTETDSPFLSPDPLRGKPNEPARVSLVAQALATVRELPLEEFAAATVSNARRAFRLDPIDHAAPAS